MGSQIFDYWYVYCAYEFYWWQIADYGRFDTSRFILEHYVDGDLVNEDYPTNRSLASPDSLHVWGKHLII
jgi:hypothetical protein